MHELRKQLIEKDTLLTETRLEALSSVHQLESLKETVNKMKSELTCLKMDNEKLQSQVMLRRFHRKEGKITKYMNKERNFVFFIIHILEKIDQLMRNANSTYFRL